MQCAALFSSLGGVISEKVELLSAHRVWLVPQEAPRSIQSSKVFYQYELIGCPQRVNVFACHSVGFGESLITYRHLSGF